MFRSKKKKAHTRKRREAEAEEDVDVDVHPVAEAAPEEEADGDDGGESSVVEQLRRSRARASGPTKSAMSFSSTTKRSRSRGVSSHVAVASSVQVDAVAPDLLSFDAGAAETKTSKRKTKMRPNLVAASSSMEVEMQVETPASAYSAEMLASLRSEQNVLFPGQAADQEGQGNIALGPLPAQNNEQGDVVDVEMEEVLDVEAGNDTTARKRVEEMTIQDIDADREEEFIPLQSKMMKTRREKKRVTFGVHSDGPALSKDAEVVEEVPSDGEESDDGGEQSRLWEEELMRRGGHRVTSSSESTTSRKHLDEPAYPTRRKVPCGSLSSVLGKLEKDLESSLFENDRASRELARIEAETALTEATMKRQREELLSSGEEFEYFQVIEDFVKGLSFCLREKLPVLEAQEKELQDERVELVTRTRQTEHNNVGEEVKRGLALGTLQEADVVGLSALNLSSNGVNDATPASMALADDQARESRLRRFQQHFTESYAPVARQVETEVDLFGDAIEEISSLDGVYGRFQEWRAKFPDVYKDSYCELALEKLYAPYVRAELLGWDPLGAADTMPDRKTWSLGGSHWFQTLRQHLRQSNGTDSSDIDDPLLYQIRDVLLEKARMAVTSYFDPYSNLQTRSLVLLLEELSRHGLTGHVESALTTLTGLVFDKFSSEAKSVVLVAVDQNTAEANEDIRWLAQYQIEKFNALQDNLLTLFVALPKQGAAATNSIAAAGFKCLMQVFHHLLAYVRHCQAIQKMHLVPAATQIVAQLSGSSFLLQLLSEPSQERELKHLTALFSPFLHP